MKFRIIPYNENEYLTHDVYIDVDFESCPILGTSIYLDDKSIQELNNKAEQYRDRLTDIFQDAQYGNNEIDFCDYHKVTDVTIFGSEEEFIYVITLSKG